MEFVSSSTPDILIASPDAWKRPRAPMQPVGRGHEGLKTGREHFGATSGYFITEATHSELHREFIAMARRAKLDHAPDLILVHTPVPNAAAVSKDTVILSDSLMNMLTFDETVAVLGHELAHVSKIIPQAIWRGLVPFAAFLGGIIAATKSEKLHFKKDDRWYQMAGKFLAIYCIGNLCSFLAETIGVHLTEKQSDTIGAQISMRPEALRTALEKLDSPDKGHEWERIAKGYPSMDSRMRSLSKRSEASPRHATGKIPVTTVMTSLSNTHGTASGELAQQAVIEV